MNMQIRTLNHLTKFFILTILFLLLLSATNHANAYKAEGWGYDQFYIGTPYQYPSPGWHGYYGWKHRHNMNSDNIQFPLKPAKWVPAQCYWTPEGKVWIPGFWQWN